MEILHIFPPRKTMLNQIRISANQFARRKNGGTVWG